jgi:hypothetical protein
MIVACILLIWLGSSALHTFALCRSASEPVPKPNR